MICPYRDKSRSYIEIHAPSKDGDSTMVRGYERYYPAECVRTGCAAWQNGRCAYNQNKQ